MSLKTLLLLSCLLATSCGDTSTNKVNSATVAKPTATTIPTPVVPKNGDYPGKGKVTKINLELGSVELDHEDIPGLMPKMIMEFFVADKKQLDTLKVGDSVDFTVRYKDGQENIVDIKKTK